MTDGPNEAIHDAISAAPPKWFPEPSTLSPKQVTRFLNKRSKCRTLPGNVVKIIKSAGSQGETKKKKERIQEMKAEKAGRKRLAERKEKSKEKERDKIQHTRREVRVS